MSSTDVSEEKVIGVAWLIVVAAVVFAVLTLLGFLWFAYDSNKRVRKFANSTDLVPGKPGRAPTEWTKSAGPEAVLHRRIRYAMGLVYENPALRNDNELRAARDRLDTAVFTLDDELIAAAQTKDNADELHRIGWAVRWLELLPGELFYASKPDALSTIDAAIANLRDPAEPPPEEPENPDDPDEDN
jgi:hypothetical protein